ncbi:MAG: STAS/SEC14 domain-containing protein [Candidatus Dormibacteraceae bacterium]
MSEGIIKAEAARAGGIYFDRPGVAVVTWDPACKAAQIEWQGWADPIEFAEASDAVLRALNDHRGSRVLGDLRKMKVIQQSNQDWARQDWLPRILAAGLTRMALVIAESGLAMMNVESILSRVPETSLDIGYFATIEEARTWLTRPTTVTPSSLEAKPLS